MTSADVAIIRAGIAGCAPSGPGSCTSPPDAPPVIDRVASGEGLVVAAGFSGHGFGIGPVAGELIADVISGAAPRELRLHG